MAEAVGVAAAAIQLAGISFRVIKLIHSLDASSAFIKAKTRQLETFTEIAENIQLHSEQHDDPEHLKLTKRVLEHCQDTVSKILAHLERVSTSGNDNVLKKVSKALIAKLEGEEVTELFDELQRDQMSLLAHRSYAQPSQSFLEELKIVFEDSLKYSTPGDEESRLLRALFVTDPRDDRSALITTKGRRVEGTCTWITETLTYRSWLSTSTDSRGLLIQGGPGRGKSMIAIFLTEQLEELAKSTATETVIYFFCDNRDLKRNSSTSVLQGLIWQLCRLRPKLMGHGLKELESRGGDAQAFVGSNSTEMLWRLFLDMVKDPLSGTITCIIDGLDECDDVSINSLSDKFSQLLASTEPSLRKCRVIICSRPPRTQHLNSLWNLPRIRLDPDSDEEIGRDITIFIENRVSEIAREKSWPLDLQQHVKSILRDKANGTFLWVGFVAQDLRKRSASEIPRCLRSLPEDLDAIYARILLEIPDEYRERVRLLLSWVTLAFEPLSLRELEALMKNQSLRSSGLNNREESIEACLEFCSPILTVKQRVRTYPIFFKDRAETIQTIQLIHQSAKDYLVRSAIDTKRELEFFRITSHMTHESLAAGCLEVLQKKLPLWFQEPFGEVGRSFLLRYAANFWFVHLRECSRQPHDSLLAKSALAFLEKGSQVREFWFAYLMSQSQSPSRAPLDVRQKYSGYLLTSWGRSLPKWAEYRRVAGRFGMIDNLSTAPSREDFFWPVHLYSLHLAALLGLEAIVRFILETKSRLYYARWTSFRSIVYGYYPQLLVWESPGIHDLFMRLAPHIERSDLERQALHKTRASSPLELAVFGGYERIVRLLSEQHPHLSLLPRPRYALYTAIHRGYEGMLKTLIEVVGVKLEPVGKFEGPLCTAVASKRVDMIRLLLGYGNNAWKGGKAKRREATRALLKATECSWLGSTTIIQYASLLLQAGADLDGLGSDMKEFTPLGYACLSCDIPVVKFLLKRGANCNLGSLETKRTPLMLAAEGLFSMLPGGGIPGTIKVLLDAGADTNRRDRHGEGVLHRIANSIASYGPGSYAYEAADILIAAGIDEDLKDKKKRTAASILASVGAATWTQAPRMMGEGASSCKGGSFSHI
ncbi:vegetatible incompatibility HET-E-1 [Fusarium albosuccineum]|uniref:Vegetatible incompatibility HET-E-1 n=1 Tax=Fusarium albosuccineum TaxID=1237068 RepID=A0A8H4LEK7_9HYPO|nr:vegetatible incompatibility HET-E-1 [Fusarium albosuccineum]